MTMHLPCLSALLSMLLLPVLALAQAGDHGNYYDYIELRGARDVKGTVIDYSYGESVSYVTALGDTITQPWSKVKSVRFEVDRSPSRPMATPRPPATLAGLPDRKWFHQVTATVGLSESSLDPTTAFSSSRRNLSTGASYHHVRPLNTFLVGVGGGAEIMSSVNNERVVTATAFAEYQLGKQRLRPLLRLLGGLNLPLGHPDLQLTSRQVGTVVHPAVGFVLLPPQGSYGTLVFDLGYRLTAVAFTNQSSDLEIVRRDISYRRLLFTLGTRF